MNLAEPPEHNAAAAAPRQLRIAVVVQRYGLQINGGAELHARHFAEMLSSGHSVTVLSTRALDYTRWDHHFPAGEDVVDGIRVLRFHHPEAGNRGRAKVPGRHVWRYRLSKLTRWLGLPGVARAASTGQQGGQGGQTYLEAQGPFSEGLLQHLATADARYDVVVFFTARFHPTAAGVLACTAPSVLVPTLHDERSMYLPLFHQVFRKPSVILWNCDAEQQLGQQLYGRDLAPGQVCGDAVCVPDKPPPSAQIAAAKERFAVDAPYFVFVGRVSRSKGFDALASAFAKLRRSHGQNVQLLVIGQSFMQKLPEVPGIIYAGFVADADRDALMAGSIATVVTSRHESLSLVTLESLALGVPVVVNGRSAVLRHHVQQSGAGLAYSAQSPLRSALQAMLQLSTSDRLAMADAGRRYVQDHYSPERVRETLLQAVQNAAAN